MQSLESQIRKSSILQIAGWQNRSALVALPKTVAAEIAWTERFERMTVRATAQAIPLLSKAQGPLKPAA
jgi:hypothetical protein